MNKDNIRAQMVVNDQIINVLRVDDKEFISYLVLRESIHNENFIGV